MQPENEVRFYAQKILELMQKEEEPFEPQVLVQATRLPSGAIEVTTNTSKLKDKLEYILESYDDEMRLITNTDIRIENILIV